MSNFETMRRREEISGALVDCLKRAVQRKELINTPYERFAIYEKSTGNKENLNLLMLKAFDKLPLEVAQELDNIAVQAVMYWAQQEQRAQQEKAALAQQAQMLGLKLS